jgi:hypothetical protein
MFSHCLFSAAGKRLLPPGTFARPDTMGRTVSAVALHASRQFGVARPARTRKTAEPPSALEHSLLAELDDQCAASSTPAGSSSAVIAPAL